MTPGQFEEYFEKIARQLKEIGHSDEAKRFARFDIEEVLGSLVHEVNLNHWCLLLESYEGSLSSRGDEAVSNGMTGAFMVIRKCDMGDFTQEKQTISDSLVIGKKIIARLIRDNRLAIQGEMPRELRGFNASRVPYYKVGPVFENAFGYRFEVNFTENESLIMEAGDWDETI